MENSSEKRLMDLYIEKYRSKLFPVNYNITEQDKLSLFDTFGYKVFEFNEALALVFGYRADEVVINNLIENVQ